MNNGRPWMYWPPSRALVLAASVAIIAVALLGSLSYTTVHTLHNSKINTAQQQEINQLKLIDQEIKDATNPNSAQSQRAAAAQAVVVRSLILCLENHEDRLAAYLAGHKPPPPKPGCP